MTGKYFCLNIDTFLGHCWTETFFKIMTCEGGNNHCLCGKWLVIIIVNFGNFCTFISECAPVAYNCDLTEKRKTPTILHHTIIDLMNSSWKYVTEITISDDFISIRFSLVYWKIPIFSCEIFKKNIFSCWSVLLSLKVGINVCFEPCMLLFDNVVCVSIKLTWQSALLTIQLAPDLENYKKH